MATITHVLTIDYVAEILDEDPELLRAIVRNSDNLTYGSIISVYAGSDEAITALTDDGIDELSQMLAHARRSTDEWNDFLKAFVDDEELIARFKAKSPR
ncbi:hypothetical protein [Pararhizobium sp. LjRoot238]|uniref:hypothetical protein n=1 Tax=Pararhizobium sp. LjRoot238 TaxID=3342293 RepID=UPI003ED03814